MSTIPDAAVLAGFKVFATPATYTPPSGPDVACRVIMDRRSRRTDAGDTTLTRGSVMVDVLASEVPQPHIGGQFTVNAVTYTVLASPEALDPERLVWRCLCRA